MFQLKSTLLSFQKDTVRWMEYMEKTCDGGMVFLDTGLGKSICSISMFITNPKKTIIICPAGLIDNWKQEIQKHTNMYSINFSAYYA